MRRFDPHALRKHIVDLQVLPPNLARIVGAYMSERDLRYVLGMGIREVIEYAITTNNLDLARQIFAKTGKVSQRRLMAGLGRLHMLKWFHTKRAAKLSIVEIEMAVVGGHVDTMEWLHAHEYAWTGGECLYALENPNPRVLRALCP